MQIKLYKDNVELLSCTSMKYLNNFVEEFYPHDDCLWVNVDGRWWNYLELKTMGVTNGI